MRASQNASNSVQNQAKRRKYYYIRHFRTFNGTSQGGRHEMRQITYKTAIPNIDPDGTKKICILLEFSWKACSMRVRSHSNQCTLKFYAISRIWAPPAARPTQCSQNLVFLRILWIGHRLLFYRFFTQNRSPQKTTR